MGFITYFSKIIGIIAASLSLIFFLDPFCTPWKILVFYGPIVWYLFLVFVLVANPVVGWFTVNLFPKKRVANPPKVTIIKPLYGLDHNLEENLTSFIEIDYPNYEVIFSMESEKDLAYPVACSVLEKAKHKSVPTVRITTKFEKHGINPKVNNMVSAYEDSSSEWVFLADSSTLAQKELLWSLINKVDDDVGVVTNMMAGVAPQQFGGWMEACYLNAYCSRAMILTNFLGYDIPVVGKGMMFRRAVCDQFGGLRALAMCSAEDVVMGEKMLERGLRTELCSLTINEVIGPKTFHDFYKRHSRWCTTRRCSNIPQYFGELFVGTFMAMFVAGQVLSTLFNCSFASGMLFHFTLAVVCDCASIFVASPSSSWPVYIVAPLTIPISFVLWLHGILISDVHWRGRQMTMAGAGSQGKYVEEKSA
eukprot:GCRY01003460.1.p1 GENE.GCRY01003460.1~~GCRY01003460.1.p1  ORF type:complete len:420 (+),score=60.19 GCRY01003460.1:113-1372(+)